MDVVTPYRTINLKMKTEATLKISITAIPNTTALNRWITRARPERRI